ncbi:MAG: hypothetical protein AAGC55_19205 [Myxococcota bacterium]
MNLDKSSQLFFGCKIDSKLRDALANAKPGDRRYFEGENSEFLRILPVAESQKNEEWIGKLIKGGINISEIEDVQRNVVSILRRIATGVRISPSSVKIFAVGSEQADSARGDSAASSGPYIANY